MVLIFVIGKGFLEMDEDYNITYTLYPKTHDNVLKFNDEEEVDIWVYQNNFSEEILVVNTSDL